MQSIDDGQAHESDAAPSWRSAPGSTGPSEAGIAQVILTAVLVAVAFAAGWLATGS